MKVLGLFYLTNLLCTFALVGTEWICASDQQALKFVQNHQNAFVVLSYPCMDGIEEAVLESYLSEKGTLAYKRYATFNENGSNALIRECYKYEGHSPQHMQNIYKEVFPHNGGRVIVYVYLCESLDRMREVKEGVRRHYGNKWVIHATDNQTQSLEIAQYVLLDNGIHFLNFSNYKNSRSYKNFNKMLEIYKQEIKNNDHFTIDGSAVLSAYGLRDCSDIDYLTTVQIDLPKAVRPFISDHHGELSFHSASLEELVNNSDHFFYYRGVKFVALYPTYTMKQNRFDAQGQHKDLNDLKLMSPIL